MLLAARAKLLALASAGRVCCNALTLFINFPLNYSEFEAAGFGLLLQLQSADTTHVDLNLYSCGIDAAGFGLLLQMLNTNTARKVRS